MARTQRELTGDGPAVRFANRLRDARREADLTLRRLSEISGYSVGALSTAESGRKIPSWDVTEAFVRACKRTDIGRWRGWWEAERDRARSEPAPSQPPAETVAMPVPDRRTGWWRPVLGAAAAAVVSAAITLAATVFLGSVATTPHPALTVRHAPACSPADQTRVAMKPVVYHGRTVGRLELWHSAVCHTNWARFVLPRGWKSKVLLNTPAGVNCAPVQCTMLVSGRFPPETAMLVDRNGPAMAIGDVRFPDGTQSQYTAGTTGH